MKYYNSIKEKGDYFISGELKIDKFQDLLDTLEKIKNLDKDVKVLYRGQPEAKYMLYSSLQRLWINSKLENHYSSYAELINNLISHSKEWNRKLIFKYLKYFGSEENEMSYLSIMQHYGIPTPLLDFTLDIDKSLYFAIEGIDHTPANKEIEKYFSIYYIFKKNSALYVSDFFMNKMIDYAKNNNIEKHKNLSSSLQFDMLLIDNSDKEFRIQNNLNILNQDGAFIFNSSPTEPLESHYVKYREMFSEIGKKKNQDLRFPKEIGGCLNINKNLSEQIIDYLKKNGIDENLIYPDLNNLKKDCLSKEWKNIST